VFIVVAVFGHALNLALSTLGAYVHTSRLQYVEFFGKFYEGGGLAWAPLRSRTKYTEIVSND
jgi:V/A-type H+-transporting ATPase subunit I